MARSVSVVRLKSTQKVLIGFDFAGMLGHDQARHHFQYLADTRDGPRVQFRAADDLFAGGGGLKIAWPGNGGIWRNADCGRRGELARLDGGCISGGCISYGALAPRCLSGPLRRDGFGSRHRYRRQPAGLRGRDVLCVRRRPEHDQGCGGERCPPNGPTHAHAPHDSCYNRHATAPVRPNPMSYASKSSMTIQ